MAVSAGSYVNEGATFVGTYHMPTEYHPLIRELLLMLPPTGSVLNLVDRHKWITAAEAIFDLVYEDGIERKQRKEWRRNGTEQDRTKR